MKEKSANTALKQKPAGDLQGACDNAARPYIAVAPMMDWTDRHCRYFHRLISPNTRLFTEMVTTGALIHGDTERFLRFDKAEHPVVLQLGGDNPTDLATCAKIAEDHGYDEINLNCGCPSDRVQSGNFGACLMAQPKLVAKCVAAMIKACDIPVTLKCRIAIDEEEELPFLKRYIDVTSVAGCTEYTIHARKAWLKGLSPKENREVPPLRYDIAAQMKEDYPHLKFIVNGGIKTVQETQAHLEVFDGVMIGREAYQNPYILAEIERHIFANTAVKSREEIVEAMVPYIEEQMHDHGTPVKSITRHMLGLFKEQAGSNIWKRYISENAFQKDTKASILLDALALIPDHTRKQSA